MLAINGSSILWTNSRHGGSHVSALNSFLTTHSDLGWRLSEQIVVGVLRVSGS